jgi:hypothetical protein
LCELTNRVPGGLSGIRRMPATTAALLTIVTVGTTITERLRTVPDKRVDGVWGENVNGGFGVSGSTNAASGPGGTIAGAWGSNSGAGAGGIGTGAYRGKFNGTEASLRLDPSNSAGQPTTGEHSVGEFYVDSTGALFYGRSSGTPGTWVKLA